MKNIIEGKYKKKQMMGLFVRFLKEKTQYIIPSTPQQNEVAVGGNNTFIITPDKD